MTDDDLAGLVLEVAASGAPQLERAQALVDGLCERLGLDAVWLTLCDPTSRVYATVGTALPEVSGLGVPAEPPATVRVPLREADGTHLGTLGLLLHEDAGSQAWPTASPGWCP